MAAAGKVPFVHADLIDGLSAREVAVDFIAAQPAAAGIISTKPALIRRARELGLCAVQRFFVLDSIALENLKRQLENTRPDSIEILPGVMPKVIRRITGFAGCRSSPAALSAIRRTSSPPWTPVPPPFPPPTPPSGFCKEVRL